MAERGATLDHSTVQKWVVYYSPKLESEFKIRNKPIGKSWRMVSGKWCYLYRAVDKEGKTIDFMLSKL